LKALAITESNSILLVIGAVMNSYLFIVNTYVSDVMVRMNHTRTAQFRCIFFSLNLIKSIQISSYIVTC